MTEPPLRDLKRNTELLIMKEFLETPAVKLKDIAARVGMTVQAVSQYVAAMKREGLLREHGGRLRPTRKGMQMLQEHFTKLKSEVDSTLRKLMVIDTCVAIAGQNIEKGQKVGLVMEDGMLMAFPGIASSSKGVALEAASESDDVLVSQLKGIVSMELGKLLVIVAPSEFEGGSKRADVARVRQRVEDFSPGLLVAGDTVGAALLMKASGELVSIHAPVESAMSALSKGVDVVFCGSEDSARQIIDAVVNLKKETGYEIKWKSLQA